MTSWRNCFEKHFVGRLDFGEGCGDIVMCPMEQKSCCPTRQLRGRRCYILRHLCSGLASCPSLSPQTTVPPFTPSPTECQSTSLVSNSPVLSGSYSSGISSLSRCSVSEASGTELPAGDHPSHLPPPSTNLPNSISSSSDEPIRRENKTPPPYSVYERNNPRRPVPLPHSLSIPPQTDPPALPPKPHQLRTGSMKLEGTSDPRVPRPRPLPRKVSQL